MKQTETTVVRQRKPSQLVAIISAALLLIAIIASTVLGIFLPKTSVVAAPAGSGDYTSIQAIGEDFYAATTRGLVARMDSNGKEKFSINLIDEGKKYGITDVGTKVDTVQRERGTDNIWAFTNGRYLFRLQENNNGFEVKEYIPMKNGMYTWQEKNGYFYVLEQDGQGAYLRTYKIGELADGPVYEGTIYSANRKGVASNSKVELTFAKNIAILSFEIIEVDGVTYAYIVHKNGLHRVAVDCNQNNWKTRFNTKYEEEYAATYEGLYQAAYDKAVADAEAKGEEVDAEKVARSARNAAILQIRERAAERMVSEEGVISYNFENDNVELAEADFDTNQYNSFSTQGDSYQGCAYSEKNQKYYIMTGKKQIISVDVKQDFSDKKAGKWKIEEENTSMELPHTPSNKGNSIYFDKDLNIGYVIYDKTSQVTRIDFNTEKIDFTAKVDFDIRSIIQNPDGENFFYMYLNAYETEAGAYILRSASTIRRDVQTTLTTLMVIAIVFAVLMAIVLLFALLCIYKEGFSPKFVHIMRGFKKQWVIYLIILATMSLVALFCFYPAIGSISLSFFDYFSGEERRLWNHFNHYKLIFTDQESLGQFLNMFIFLFSDLFTALLPPLIFAFFLTIMRNKSYSALTRTLLFIPGIIPGLATTLLWKEGIYGISGVVNEFLSFIMGKDVEIEFLASVENTSMVKWSLIMMGFPFVGSYLIFYGAMMNVPDSYYEAAELDGITVIKRFVFIDVPLIFAQIKYVFIMTFIASVQNFGRTYMTGTGGAHGAQTPVHTMYDAIMKNPANYGLASAYATILFIFLFIATALNMRIQTKDNQVA